MARTTRGMLAAMTSLALLEAAAAWTPETCISPEFAGVYGDPAVMFDSANRLHVVYMANPAGQSVHIYYRVFDGVNWSPPVDLPGPNYKEPECAAAVDAVGNVHVVGMYRVDGTIDKPYTIYYWRFDGVAWSGPVMLSSGQGGDGNNCSSPDIAVDRNGNLHAAWAQNGMTGGESDIMYRKCLGGTWQAIQNVTANNAGTSYGSVSPDLTVDRFGDTVHLVWHDDFLNNGFQAYYASNTNLGDPAAWTPKAQWFQLSTGDYGKGPGVMLDPSDRPHVFWTDRFGGSENKLGYRRWTGSAWTAAANWGVIAYEGAAFDADGKMRFLYKAPQPGQETLELWHRLYDPTANSFGAAELISTGASTLKVDFAAVAIDYWGYSNLVWSERKGEWPGVGGLYYSAQALPQPPLVGPSGTIAGFVRDQFGVGVTGARVLVPAGWSTLSGADGAYALRLPVGPHQVSATKDLYDTHVQPVTIAENQSHVIDFVVAGRAPDPLVELKVIPGNRSNQITWTAAANPSLSGLVVRYATQAPPASPDDGVPLFEGPISAGIGPTLSHAPLPNGKPCYYTGFTYFEGASRYYAAGTAATGTPAGPGDLDRDGDVDQGDFGLLQNCFSGSYVPQTDPACRGARFDGDDDVDQDDVARFLLCFSGPDVPSNAECAQ